MEWNGRKVPAWAVLNTALLSSPLFLGLGIFRFWFIPNPSLKVPALGFLVVYYCVVFYVCKRTSGVNDLWGEYKKTNPTWRNYLGVAVGWVMFAFIGYAAFYVSLPAVATSIAGREVIKEFNIVSAKALYRTGCRYELRLEGVSPAIGAGFCIPVEQFDSRWVEGSKVMLKGRESVLGFRFTEIGS